ncbi:ciliated left-right organizer metallopeptidase-like [Tubulanus polymorphus]|uniref:ciliated left-right organizer metallopeptidase-like n=1 Tax=Tubulanus polymorphus TaxID=672921 RepID=UPI003DA409F2
MSWISFRPKFGAWIIYLLYIVIIVIGKMSAFSGQNMTNRINGNDSSVNGDAGENTVLDRRKAAYRNIRIKVLYFALKTQLNSVEIERLKLAVDESVAIVEKTLSVVPVNGNLVLRRSQRSCLSIHTKGPNKGKCAQWRRGYSGDYCINKGFKIPEDHLAGLYIWNDTHSDPIIIRPAGIGVDNTDFILYVQAKMQGNCLDKDRVIAFAKYCKQDENNRPTAGLINVCPESLKIPNYTPEKSVQAFVHEMFHALGFTSDLFKQFKDCSKTDVGKICPDRIDTVQIIKGFHRLMTPKLVEVASKHFNCSQFGVPVQMKGSKVTSHWHARFMQDSIMAPTLGRPEQTVIDPMTLALFEDMGWYKVNSMVDTYFWGKDGGCDFGTDAYCAHDKKYFCQGNSVGCHYLHKDKGTCETDSFLQGCRVYKTIDSKQQCYNLSTIMSEMVREDGSISVVDTCLVSNITENGANTSSTEMLGSCFPRRCDENRTIEIFVGGESYICPQGKSIEVNISGAISILNCPSYSEILCPPVITHTTSSPVSVSTSLTSLPPKKHIILVVITFKNVKYANLVKHNKTEVFKHKVISAIILWTNIPPHRIQYVKLSPGSVHVSFKILPPMNASDGAPSMDIYNTLYRLIRSGNFSIDMDGIQLAASGIKKISDSGRDDDDDSSLAPVIVASVVGTLATIALIVIAIVFFNKYKASQASNVSAYNFEMRPQGTSDGSVSDREIAVHI